MKTTSNPKRQASRKPARKPARRNHVLVPPRGTATPKPNWSQTHPTGKPALRDRVSSSPPLPVALSSFNPALPEDGALIIAEVLRDQLNSLFAMIQSIPAGPPGPEGPQGPPFAQAVVDGVTTLAPGTPAWVTVGYYNSNVHFAFGIPTGDPGAQGPPGEVTTAQLNAAVAAAIAGTSSNTNGVATMDTPFTNDPPTLADMELIRAKYNELVLAARR